MSAKRKPKRIIKKKFKNSIHEILVIESILSETAPRRFVVMFITKHHFVGLTEVRACIQSKVFVNYTRALEQAFTWLSEITSEYMSNERK